MLFNVQPLQQEWAPVTKRLDIKPLALFRKVLPGNFPKNHTRITFRQEVNNLDTPDDNLNIVQI